MSMLCRRYTRTAPGQWAMAEALVRQPQDGMTVAAFERAVAQQAGRRHGIAVASGRHGLALLCAALGLQPGDEVVFPAYTLKDLVLLLQRAGYVPRVADIDPATYQMTPATLAAALTPRTKLVIATHLFGVPCDIRGIIAAAGSIPVVEDCAHALGASLDGVPCGGSGRAAFYSFELTKPVNTFGGGMIVTDDEALAERLRAAVAALPLRTEQLQRKVRAAARERALLASPLFPLLAWSFYWPLTTRLVNALYRALQARERPQATRYSAAQAALGLQQLPELAARDARRRAVAAALFALLPAGVHRQQVPATAVVNHYFLVVTFAGCADAARARQVLLRHGIDSGIGPEIADDCAPLVVPPAACPHSAALSRRAVHLPLHEDLTGADLARIAAGCRAVVERVR